MFPPACRSPADVIWGGRGWTRAPISRGKVAAIHPVRQAAIIDAITTHTINNIVLATTGYAVPLLSIFENNDDLAPVLIAIRRSVEKTANSARGWRTTGIVRRATNQWWPPASTAPLDREDRIRRAAAHGQHRVRLRVRGPRTTAAEAQVYDRA